MSEPSALQTFQDDVVQEVRLLQGRLPEWRQGRPYANHLRPLDPLERREAERLDRLLRQERAAGGERNRERALRERSRPWSEDERWTLRKRVWCERRDRERELLEQRELALLRREEELSRLGAQFKGWLAEIQELEPDSSGWCAQQARLSEDTGITPDLLDQIHLRRRAAAERHARELLARADVRAALGPALAAAQRDPLALAQAIAPPLAALGAPASALRRPIVIAAMALLLGPSRGEDAII
jgi:hypothetical protein